MIETAKLAFANPPVWEVGLSATTAMPLMDAYEIREIHDLFRDRFPGWERQSPFLGSQPFPTPGAPMTMNIPLIMGGGVPEATRFWFLTEDNANLTQVQDNFTARNWRRGALDAPANYPGYAVLKTDFIKQIEILSGWNSRHGRQMPTPISCELLYDNMIPLMRADGARLKMADVLTCLNPFSSPVRGYAAQWFENIDAPDDRFNASDFQVQIAGIGAPVGGGDSQPFIKLMFVGRFAQSTWGGVFEFFDKVHAHVHRRLVELTTDAVRATWI